MPFPTAPSNGQSAVVNGMSYTYNSTTTAWTRVGATSTPLSSYALLTGATFTGNVVVDSSLQARRYLETRVNPTISAGSLTLDLSAGNYFDISLNASVTTIAVSNAPTSGVPYSFTMQVNYPDNTSRTIDWVDLGVKWTDNSAPSLTCANTKVDTFVFYTDDSGSNLYGSVAGQNQ